MDISVFNDWQNFTTPTSQYNERATVAEGGYRQIGNTVYVYVRIKPTPATESFWKAGGGGGVLAGFPKVKTPMVLTAFAFSSNYGAVYAEMRNNMVNEGQISSCSVTPNQSMDLSQTITFQGIYQTE